MIRRVFSSLSTFKALDFHSGFNVLVAEKTPGARPDQTRNAAGKSTLLEIVHYLLGAKVEKDSLFLHEDIANESFGIVFDCTGSQVTVERAAEPPKIRNLFAIEGSVPEALDSLRKGMDGDLVVPLAKWKSYLGQSFFGLPEEPGTFEPKFRSLFSYFCRREPGGFIDSTRQSDKQQPWDQNVAIAYFIGLDWRLLTEMEKLRNREKSLDRLKKELSGNDVVADVLGSSASLQSRLAIQKRRADEFERRLAAFEVLPEYEEFEQEASQLRTRIAELRDANTLDRQLIEQLETDLSGERSPGDQDLERVYRAAGIQLPEVALRSLDELRKFHETIVANRRKYLGDEIKAAHRRIEKRTTEASQMESRERELIRLLAGRGALAHYNELQVEASRVRGEVEALTRRLEIVRKIETGSADLAVERAELHRRMVNDHRERSEILNEAIVLYDDLSRKLCERSSILKIEPTESGLSVSIEGGPDARSRGIKEQQIFCFDMMLAVLLRQKRPDGLDFLFHDSHLFDAMEERQIARAFELGTSLAEKHGFQYVVTLNDDRIPRTAFSKGFDFDKYLLPVRLSDATEDGGLLGIRLRDKSA